MNTLGPCFETIGTITPLQLKRLLLTDTPPLVLDVREAEELTICALPNGVHIPLGDLPSVAYKLPEDRVIVTLCHHGRRSFQAALWLKSRGFAEVLNLNGGIHAWAEQVDPSMRRY
ncbi:MAG: sulfurtransferase [Alphaproteobacteria bacterium]|jgi:rhodanese-related sulfurtransferase|nr:sulfurtransferase [Alphaproteobacteria bacterium]